MKLLIFSLLALTSTSSAEAQLACSLSATPVQFGSITGTSAGTLDARGSITVTCTGSQGTSVAACIEVGSGAASGQRTLAPAKGAALPVQIFQDATLTRPWGMAAMNQAAILQRTGDGPMSATAYLRAYVQKGSGDPGTYTAQFPVTLRYGAVTGSFVDCNALGTIGVGPASPSQRNVSAFPAPPRKR